MPDTFEAAVVFSMLIAPGALFVRGYARRRTRSFPERDLHALVQAIVASLVWLGATWTVFGERIATWAASATPAPAPRLAILAFVLTPFVLGVAAALIVDSISRRPTSVPARVLGWTGIFDPPSAWDAAWLSRYPEDDRYREVSVRLKGGTLIVGRFAGRSQVDLSPIPRQLFLETGYGYINQEDGTTRLDAHGPHGIYVEASEIEAIYFGETVEIT
jgi:hypothetical protein